MLKDVPDYELSRRFRSKADFISYLGEGRKFSRAIRCLIIL